MFRGRYLSVASHHAQVIDSLQNDQIADARLGEDVIIDPGQRVRPQSVEQKAVAAEPVV